MSKSKMHSFVFEHFIVLSAIISEGVGLNESDITFCFPFPLITNEISKSSDELRNKLKK